MRTVAVRVVPIAEKRLLGWVVGVLGGAAVLSTTMEIPFSYSHEIRYGAIGAALTLWNVGMLLAWRPRPWAGTARVESGVLVVEGRGRHRAVVSGDDVSVSIARGEHGLAMAIAGGAMVGGGAEEALLLEVETEADARAVLAMLNVPWPGRGSVTMRHRREIYVATQRISAIAGAIGGLLYFTMVGLWSDYDWKPIGLLGLSGLLSSLMYVVEPLLRRTTTLGRDEGANAWGALGRHVMLHRASAVTEEAAPASIEPRVRVLVRGDESTADWLSRLDALEVGGYRGDARGKDELFALVDDSKAEPLARLGAARVLVKRHGVPAAEVTKRVDASLETRIRVAVTGEAVEAARAIDELAPDVEAPPSLRAMRRR